MKVDVPKLNPIMYHWNFCDYCRGTGLGAILFHLDCINKGIRLEMKSEEDLKVLEKFPLMTDTLEGVSP